MRIKNPQAYEKAKQKREHHRSTLVSKIAGRLAPIIRRKFDGVLVVGNLYQAYILLAQDGGIKPAEGRPNRLNKQRNERQRLVSEALNLAIERGYIIMDDSFGEEIKLSTPPVESVIDNVEGQDGIDYYEEHVIRLVRTPVCTLRQWGVV